MSLESECNIAPEQWDAICREAGQVGPLMRRMGEPYATMALQDSARAAFGSWPEPYCFRLAVGYFGDAEARRLYIRYATQNGTPEKDARTRFNKYYPETLMERVANWFRR